MFVSMLGFMYAGGGGWGVYTRGGILNMMYVNTPKIYNKHRIANQSVVLLSNSIRGAMGKLNSLKLYI